MIRRFLLRILSNALALYLVTSLVPGVSFRGDWKAYVFAGLIFAVINAFLKPILKLVSMPFIVLTLGLFSIVVNMATLWILVQVVTELSIRDWWSYLWATLVIGLFNLIIDPLFAKKPLDK